MSFTPAQGAGHLPPTRFSGVGAAVVESSGNVAQSADRPLSSAIAEKECAAAHSRRPMGGADARVCGPRCPVPPRRAIFVIREPVLRRPRWPVRYAPPAVPSPSVERQLPLRCAAGIEVAWGMAEKNIHPAPTPRAGLRRSNFVIFEAIVLRSPAKAQNVDGIATAGTAPLETARWRKVRSCALTA